MVKGWNTRVKEDMHVVEKPSITGHWGDAASTRRPQQRPSSPVSGLRYQVLAGEQGLSSHTAGGIRKRRDHLGGFWLFLKCAHTV